MARVTLEAMACGLPVIATPNSGTVVRDGVDGFLVQPRDIESLKEKIRFFYDNPHRIITMGDNARKRAEQYTWPDFGIRTANALEQFGNL